MAWTRRIIAFAVLLQSSVALVEFAKSKLYDETDFAVQNVWIPNFCELGCRIYASVPEASVDVAKQILIHDFIHDADAKSLYDISKIKIGEQKGYFEIDVGNTQVNFVNGNPGFITAPLSVWVVQKDATAPDKLIYDAADLDTLPTDFHIVTVMSAEPFFLQTKTDGKLTLVATLTGFDAISSEDDGCAYVLEQMNPEAPSDIQVNVQSPLFTIFYDDLVWVPPLTSLKANVGKGKLDFTGISFAASPGFIGCNGQKTFRSSLYPVTTQLSYSSFDRLYDVDLAIFLNTDEAHDVMIRGTGTNGGMFDLWSEPGEPLVERDYTMQQINGLDITWKRDDTNLDQSFLIRITPSNEQPNPDYHSTTDEPEKTTTEGSNEPDEKTTTVGGDDPDHPDDNPKTTPTTRRTTSERTTTTTHPKDLTSSTSMPSTSPTKPPATTSAGVGYGSTVAALSITAVFLL